MGQVVKATVIKGAGGKLMLHVEDIPLNDAAMITPDTDGNVKRATLAYATNRSTGKDGQVIVPVKGLKDDAPYVAITFSASVEGAKALGMRFAAKDVSRKPGAVKVRTASAAELLAIGK